MPPISPIARKRNPSGICRNEIGPPPLVKIRSTDEPIKKVHSVARNGLIRSPTIIAALNSPTSTPPETPARHAAAQPAPKVRIATTAKAAPKSSAMPTDRSIPPLATTSVMPSATISSTAEFSTMLSRFRASRKTGFHSAKNTANSASTAGKPAIRAIRASRAPGRAGGRAPAPAGACPGPLITPLPGPVIAAPCPRSPNRPPRRRSARP